MKFVHRLNVRALSAMVTGIMVASSMLVSAAPVAATSEAANVIRPLRGLGLPGTILITDMGDWAGTPGSLTYSWYRCTAEVPFNLANQTPIAAGKPCTLIAGAVNNTYKTLTTDLVTGRYIVAMVTSASDGSHYSASFAVASKPVLDTTDLPSITSGNVSYAAALLPRSSSSTLTLDTGTWLGEPTPTLRYYWLRCTQSAGDGSTRASGCTPISGADDGVNELTYKPTTKDVGYFIRVRIVARNQFGSVTVYTKSWDGGNITASNALNKVSGIPFTKSVLRFSGRKVLPGTWTFLPAQIGSFGYQWYLCDDAVEAQSFTASEWTTNSADGHCAEIPGQTTDTLSTAYAGFYAVRVSATNARGTGSVWSKSIYVNP